MKERCPYCDGDESRCNFDWRSDKCDQMEKHNGRKRIQKSAGRQDYDLRGDRGSRNLRR
jgi:hypothetical protein